MAKWPSDKKLEEIYRKGSEQHNFKYDPEAWDQLNTMLNKKRRRKIIVLFFAGIFLLSTLVLLFYSLSNSNSINSELSITRESTPSENQSKSETANIGNQELKSKIEYENKEIEITDNLENSGIKTENNSTDIGFTSNKVTIENNEVFNSSSNQANFEGQNSNQSDQENVIVQNSDISSITHGDQISQEKIPANPLNIKTGTILEKNELNNYDTNQHPANLLKIALIPGLNINQIESSDLLTFTIPEMVETQLSEEENKSSAFAINTMAGLESSWTPNGEYSRLDFSLGLGGTYYFNQKLGVSLGVNYISDSYTALEADYSPPKGYWENRGVPSWTKATCNMIETSYGISYYFKGRAKRGLAVNLNFLSNLMVSEDYYYHYEDRDKNFVSSWKMDNSTFLSSISIGTEYNIPFSNKTLLRIGPFIKFPIEGIGHGKVMLSSFGLRMQASFMTK